MIPIDIYIKPKAVFKVQPSSWDVDVSIKVQFDIVGSLIQESIDRIKIKEIIDSQPEFIDPAVF